MTSAMDAERDKYSMMNFEETELRLGLPGGSSSNGGESSSSALIRTNGGNNKRGFSETADGVVDLKLNLSSSNHHDDLGSALVSASSVALDTAKEKSSSSSSNSITTAATASLPRANDPAKPPAKAQVVGWPPVRSFRKNIVNVQRSNKEEEEAAEKATTATTTTTTTATSSGALNNAAFVKVSVDGAPYLRKVDLKLYNSYKELSDALAKMFSSFTINGNCGSQGIVDKEFMNESKKLMHLLNGSDYVPTYEDKDGDWMLVGDVPWQMFVESCKRLRIVKGSEAIGLAPRAVEKCKNRS